MLFLGLDEGDFTVFGGMNRVIAAGVGTFTSDFGAASLADENFAGLDFLTTKALDAKALTGVVVDVLACTACFDV